ncbi:MAG: transcriptional repressor [Oscillospiraceae bacterium]
MEKRNTIQRELVLEALTNLVNHPTADEIYNEVALQHSSVSKGTVYRNLNVLVQEGILRKVPVPGAADRFDYNAYPHYHMLCTVCGCFTDAPIEYISAIDDNVKNKTGYENTSHEMVFSGVCKACAKAKP